MRPLLAILLLACASGKMHAQKLNNLYTDITLNNLGASVTYDAGLSNYLSVGGGIQIHNAKSNYNNIRSTAFIDIRPFFPYRRHIFFGFGDIGISKYDGRKLKEIAGKTDPTDLYFAFGIGWCRKLLFKEYGPYLSLAIRTNRIRYHYNNPSAPPEERDFAIFDHSLVMSLGFKI